MIENKDNPRQEWMRRHGERFAALSVRAIMARVAGLAGTAGPLLAAEPGKRPQQSTFAVDNFVGKPPTPACAARKIKALDTLPKSWAGRNDLKNNCLYVFDGCARAAAARRPSIGAAVEFYPRAGIGFAHG
jgi:hypothetical protein